MRFHVPEPSDKAPPPFDGPLFQPRSTTVFRVAIAAVVLLVVSTGYATLQYYYSPYWHAVGYRRNQPVLFSHRHHAGELHIDCRYCHAEVETSAFAGMPSTNTCLTCHSQIFTDTSMLRPVVESAARNEPLHWTRVNNLPDHVYFNHSIHIAKGVGCTTCHGEIGTQPLTAKGATLMMRWCVDCHRNPAPKLRPRDHLFDAVYTRPINQDALGAKLMAEYHVHTSQLTSCSTCHH